MQSWISVSIYHEECEWILGCEHEWGITWLPGEMCLEFLSIMIPYFKPGTKVVLDLGGDNWEYQV